MSEVTGIGMSGMLGPLYLSIEAYVWPELGFVFTTGPSYIDIRVSLLFVTLRIAISDIKEEEEEDEWD